MPNPERQDSPFATQLNMLLENQGAVKKLSATELNAIRNSNAIFLTHYQNELSRMYPDTFEFANEEKKEQLRYQLQNTLRVLTIQQSINKMDKRLDSERKLDAEIAQCENYQRQLKGQPPIEGAPPAHALPVINAAESPVKYLGLVLARWLAKLVSDDNIEAGINKLTQANQLRLYRVWENGFLMSFLQAMPTDFFNNSQAQSNLKAPDTALGYVSWILYYLRFGLNLFLLIKHSLPCCLLNENDPEKKVPAWDRANAQWQQRKFALLNDAAWGTVNLVGFFWLVSSTSLVYANNLLIVGLLLIDIVLTCWRFFEEQRQFNHTKKILDTKIADLDDSIQKLNHKLATIGEQIKRGIRINAGLNLAVQNKELTEQLAAARRQRDDLEQLLKTTDANWKLKRTSIINDLTYSCGLLVGWTLIGSVFFPPVAAAAIAQSTLMAMGLAGGVFCFVLTVTYQAIACYLEVTKIRNTMKENTVQLNKLQAEFDDLNARINAQTPYELCMGPPSTPVDNNKLYVEFFADSIYYSVKDPRNNKVVNGIIPTKTINSSLTTPLTIDKLRPHLAKILDKIPTTAHDNRVQTETQRKHLYLEIKSLEAANRHQKRMISHQKLKLLRSTIIDALIPAVIFATLVFLPTGIGIGILAAALALMVISKLILNRFEPKPEPKPKFNETEYNRTTTSAEPVQETHSDAHNRNTLFNEQRALAQRLAKAEDSVDPYEGNRPPSFGPDLV